jgi:hypothetical protein
MDRVMDADIRQPSLKLTAVAFARFLNDKTGQLNPSMSKVAAATGLSEVQARRQVHELVAMGVLSVVANHDGGRSGSSRWYCLHLDKLPGTPLISESRTPLADETPLTGETPLTSDRDASHGREGPLSLMSDTPLIGETRKEKEQGNNNEGNRNEAPRKRVAPPPAVDRPDDVAEQTWKDWLQHRKAKKAPVTETVVANARRESEKAGMPLDAFLQVWCLRGSQGLMADWLRPNERKTASRVSFAEGDAQRARDRADAWMGRRKAIDITPTTSVRAVGFETKDYDHEHL